MQARLPKTFLRRCLYFLAALLLVTGTISSPVSASAAGDTKHLDPQMIAEMNKPGVVMIQTINKATISVPDCQISQAGIQAIQNKLVQEVRSGNLENTQEAIAKAFVDEFLKDPMKYLEPTNTVITMDAQAAFMGTGFIVTPDGYIVTNAHVVYTPDNELKVDLAQSALTDQVNKDVQGFIDQVKNVYTPDNAQLQALQQADFDYYAANMTLSDISTSIYCGVGMTIPGITTVQKGYTCDLRKRGEPVPGKDVAILKIDKTDLPTVTLGDDSTMNTGQSVFVLGYPGAATYNPMLDQNASQIESTFTSGLVSAKKTMSGGWDILQIDAAITHGNSGGPVFNNNGEVIGIATFGSIDQNSGQEIQGMNFAVPISIAKQFLNELNVKPTESNLTKEYVQALDLFNQDRYKDALALFKKINDINPGYPYIQDKISQCSVNIDAGKDKSGIPATYLIIGGIAVVVIVGVFLVIIFVRKKNKPAKKQPPYGAPGNPMPPPPYGAPYGAPGNQPPPPPYGAPYGAPGNQAPPPPYGAPYGAPGNQAPPPPYGAPYGAPGNQAPPPPYGAPYGAPGNQAPPSQYGVPIGARGTPGPAVPNSTQGNPAGVPPAPPADTGNPGDKHAP